MSEENKNLPGTELELHDPARREQAARRAAELDLIQRAALDNAQQSARKASKDRPVLDLHIVGYREQDPPDREAIGRAERSVMPQTEAQRYRDRQRGQVAVEHVA